jgi:hypothetical protein
VHADAADRHDHAQHRREAVARRRRRDADHDARRVADRVLLQALVGRPLLRRFLRHRTVSHAGPLSRALSKVGRRLSERGARRSWKTSQSQRRKLVGCR